MKLEIPALSFSGNNPLLNTLQNPWKQLAENILKRNTELNNLNLAVLGFFGDHGISNTQFSKKSPQYTASMAILASERRLVAQTLKPLFFDISIERYFASIENVENNKIGKPKNFLLENALEPQRLINAIETGKSIVRKNPAQFFYLFDLGAGNDLAGESLLRKLYQLKSNSFHATQSEIFSHKTAAINIENEHPFSFLERFGGYETAAILGAIFQLVEDGKYIFIEGWSAISAYAIALKMFPKIRDFVQIACIPNSILYQEFVEQENLPILFKHAAPNEKAFYAEAIQSMLDSLIIDLKLFSTQ